MQNNIVSWHPSNERVYLHVEWGGKIGSQVVTRDAC